MYNEAYHQYFDDMVYMLILFDLHAPQNNFILERMENNWNKLSKFEKTKMQTFFDKWNERKKVA